MNEQVIERKCSHCGTWNKGPVEKCTACENTLDPHKKLVEEHDERERKRLAVPKTKLDLLIARVKHSRNPLLRLAYWLLSAIWFVYWVILSFILWAVAATPG